LSNFGTARPRFVTVQVIAYSGQPSFKIHVEIKSKSDDILLREFDFMISELNRFYCDKFEYSGTNTEVYPYIKNYSGKDLTLGVGFAYVNRSVYVDRVIELAAEGQGARMYLYDSSVSTSGFPTFDYKGFRCGTFDENRKIVTIKIEGEGLIAGEATKNPGVILTAGTYYWPVGTILELTSHAGDKHQFVGWRWTDGGLSATSDDVAITVQNDMTIIASFKKV